MTCLKYLVPLLAPFAVYSMFTFADVNGTIVAVKSARASGIIPGEDTTRLILTYTGIGPLDNVFVEVVIGFWATGRGTICAHLMCCILFLCAMVAAWILLFVELTRRRGPIEATVRAGILGLIAQIIGPGIVIPVLVAWDLFRIEPYDSPIQDSTHSLVQDILPLGTICAGIPPFATLLIPTPYVVGYDLKQCLIVIFQFWPVIASVATLALFSSHGSRLQEQKPHKWTPCLDTPYGLALLCAGGFHLSVYTLGIVAQIVPELFGPDTAADIHPFRIVLPTLPWSGARATSIEEGVFWLLQWDYLIASVSLLIWALEYTSSRQRPSVSFALRALVLAVICGPTGAAVKLMWERATRIESEREKVTTGINEHVK
ncbi:hypothetical protein N7463_010696 [Penicillium fimorum]|uniref:Uncharacterized protein n=1 Tax=Penicillium fimorum TaxID=1882269 RepID=A0A9W9XKE6_9EURO|nr:hypothetical protein N7463_010696 [Penicillium fimorum]